MRCFDCGGEGHIAPQCPHQDDLADPAGRDTPWCGQCDPRTRHLGTTDDRAARCPECHPLRARMLAQHKRCEHCRKIVVIWDSAQDCEHHILAAADRPYVPVAIRPGRTLSEDELRRLAAEQVAEARASRVVMDGTAISAAISHDIPATPIHDTADALD